MPSSASQPGMPGPATRPDAETQTGVISDVTIEGRGVVAGEGRKILVRDAIAGERVRFALRRKKRRYIQADLVEVIDASADRVDPPCIHFGRCGGCALQHVSAEGQLRIRQSALRDALSRIGGVQPGRWLKPLTGPTLGYRRKARLAVKYVFGKGRVLVGFRERDKPFVADMLSCETLVPALGELLPGLARLIEGLSLRERIPQVEAAAGDDLTALVFRVLDAPTDADRLALAQFQHDSGAAVFLQRGGPDTVEPLNGETPDRPLTYRIGGTDLVLAFGPLDFVQVNGKVNSAMVAQALELLAPGASSRVLDLFCGLGNFSVPLARHAGGVIGIEIGAGMVERARGNAAANGVENASFLAADLDAGDDLPGIDRRSFDLALLDPPRTGAAGILPFLAGSAVERLLYVSCHPGTLARDAAALTGEFGFELAAAGIADMFPHTAHVESMALFVRS